MYTPIHTFQDKRFNIHHQHEYDLIISFNEDSIRLICMADPHTCLAAETYVFPNSTPANGPLPQLQSFFQAYPFMANSAWSTVTCIIANPWYTLIPTAFYKKAFIADYLRLSGDCLQADMRFCDAQIDSHTTVLFAIHKAMRDWLNTTYLPNQLCITHQTNAIIISVQFYLRVNKLTRTPHVCVVTQGKYMYITVMHHDNLVYYNSFEYHTGDEWLQYILTVMHTLALNPKANHVLLTGDIAKNTVIYKKLRAYIRHLDCMEQPQPFHTKAARNQTWPSHYFELLNFYCAR